MSVGDRQNIRTHQLRGDDRSEYTAREGEVELFVTDALEDCLGDDTPRCRASHWDYQVPFQCSGVAVHAHSIQAYGPGVCLCYEHRREVNLYMPRIVTRQTNPSTERTQRFEIRNIQAAPQIRRSYQVDEFTEATMHTATCSICMDEKTTTRRLLNCLHDHCVDCLERWYLSGHENSKRCPTCRTWMPVDEDDPNALPDHENEEGLTDMEEASSDLEFDGFGYDSSEPEYASDLE